ncbi:conserved hypothetical protein [Novosphingobium aromaticivorans DSM 12444]|uniref:Uncharacterized protein n=1 Tax=Novosphingobium aromaticivorans (strain ATCC 700278 / DSM 12444 / CCUG 56034 / CIP 105152 / NBRC 16084 / F199) TaxID=279238 RepID=Q2GCE3_NOVAD|nr:hypothetical protein [Novosphingobium aromaticivorans]ABD24467.1 conserved hypothetical protein [Novosphingobium aromaticivorans DSM 12444]SCY27315.1 hypothetical protein SAMN05660666_01252 [Novosphingobium aromaticivorans]
MPKFAALHTIVAAAALNLWSGFVPGTALAQQPMIRATGTAVSSVSPSAPDSMTYADLADLSDASEVVLRVQVRKASRLKPEQAPGLAPGMARMLVEARTQAVLAGTAMGEAVSYLADVPLDARGKTPKLAKAQMIVFARTVPGRPGELRLVDGGAQIAWTAEREARTRGILTELLAHGAAPRIKALREVLFVPGNLAGEGETQIFLQTATGAPISLSVVRRPGSGRTWGVSLSEIVDQAARPPARDTLTWYRLACFLPQTVPAEAGLSGSAEDHRAAEEDYAFVLAELGTCSRSRPAISN